MPGTWQGRERLVSHEISNSYQSYPAVQQTMVGRSSRPFLVAICQYLSSTVRDLARSVFSPRRKEIRRLRHLHERNNL